jgi:hypothetical protein
MKSKLILLLILFCSISKLHAQNNICMTSYYNSSDKAVYYLVWDMKTGKSAQYYWDATASKWAKMEINMPAQPLPEASGEIGMKAYYDCNDKAAYYIIWDCNSGKSIQYYWDSADSKWAKMEINLPADPLK